MQCTAVQGSAVVWSALVTEMLLLLALLFFGAEQEERRSSEEEEEGGEGGEPDVVQVLGTLIMALLVKYWLYICSGMFFFVSFEGRIVMYKIIYMMMFLSCVALYQVSNGRTPRHVSRDLAAAAVVVYVRG